MLGIRKPVKVPSLQQRWRRWNSHRAPGAQIIERDDKQDEMSQFWLEIQNRSQIIQIKGSVHDRRSPSKATQPAHRPPAAVLSLVCKKTINRLVQNDSESVRDVSEILNWFPWGEGLLMGENLNWANYAARTDFAWGDGLLGTDVRNFIFGEECLSLLSSNLLEANMIERHHQVQVLKIPPTT